MSAGCRYSGCPENLDEALGWDIGEDTDGCRMGDGTDECTAIVCTEYMESRTYIFDGDRLVGKWYSRDAEVCVDLMGRGQTGILYGRECRSP